MSDTCTTPPPDVSTLVRQSLASRDVPCTRCGHNLRDTTSGRCPECGSPLRIVVEADRLGQRAWLPATVLTFMAFAAVIASVRHIAVIIEVFSKFRVSFTSSKAAPGVPTAYLPWYWWIDSTVAIGIALGATVGSILAWRAFRRGDRPSLIRAVWRCIAVGLILSLQMLANGLVYLVPRLL